MLGGVWQTNRVTPPIDGTRQASYRDLFLMCVPWFPLLMGQDELHLRIRSSDASHPSP